MAPKAVITTMVGYSTKSDAYRLLNFKTGKFIETKHVIFQEEKINSGMDKIDTSQDVDQMNMLDEERDTPREDQNDEDYIPTSVEAKKTQGNAENENVALEGEKTESKEESENQIEQENDTYQDSVSSDVSQEESSTKTMQTNDSIIGQAFKYGFGSYFNKPVEENE